MLTSQQSNIPSQASNTTNTTQTASANSPSPSVSGSSLFAAGSAPPATARSYASATKKTVPSPPIASGSTGSSQAVAVGGSATVQHGKRNSVSPVNGKPAIPPAVPAVAAPAIVNSGHAVNGSTTPGHSDHGRKSSVTISAQGAGSFISNGGSVGQPPSRTN